MSYSISTGNSIFRNMFHCSNNATSMSGLLKEGLIKLNILGINENMKSIWNSFSDWTKNIQLQCYTTKEQLVHTDAIYQHFGTDAKRIESLVLRKIIPSMKQKIQSKLKYYKQ